MNKEHKEFLDALRLSGYVNMFEAVDYIIKKFRVTKQEAKTILKE